MPLASSLDRSAHAAKSPVAPHPAATLLSRDDERGRLGITVPMNAEVGPAIGWCALVNGARIGWNHVRSNSPPARSWHRVSHPRRRCTMGGGRRNHSTTVSVLLPGLYRSTGWLEYWLVGVLAGGRCLHNQAALRLKPALYLHSGAVVVNVPRYHLPRSPCYPIRVPWQRSPATVACSSGHGVSGGGDATYRLRLQWR